MEHAALVAEAIKEAGGQSAVARACGVAQPTVFGWTRKGLPRTEWTGETNYASVIEALTDGRFPKQKLLSRPVAA